MKLVWFEVCGYRRFADNTKINLSEKLIASVGPNEAGKTSLLRSLKHISNSNNFINEGISHDEYCKRDIATVNSL